LFQAVVKLSDSGESVTTTDQSIRMIAIFAKWRLMRSTQFPISGPSQADGKGELSARHNLLV